MLLLADIKGNILLLGALTHDHSLVYGGLNADEHSSAVLCIVQAVGGRLAVLGGDQRSRETGGHVALIGLIAVEQSIDYALTERLPLLDTSV